MSDFIADLEARAAGRCAPPGAPDEISRDGAYLAGPYEDRVIVYGLVRDGVERLSVDIENEPAGGVDVAAPGPVVIAIIAGEDQRMR